MNTENILSHLSIFIEQIANWALSPAFYIQLAMVSAAFIIAYFATKELLKLSIFNREPAESRVLNFYLIAYRSAFLLFPINLVLGMEVADRVSIYFLEESWLIRFAQSLAVVLLLYSAIKRFIKSPFTAALCKWIGIPVAILQVFGWLGNVTGFLDSLALDLGDIHLTAYALIRLAIFGSVLYWLGHVSSSTGQRVIRQQEALDIGTREIFAKLFHVIVILVVLLLLMQIMGINLTTLAVFGGAVGVGIGLGLQSIASNFIAGIIILMDRSICVGDYVEFEGGQAGTIRELKMRSTTVETFDGKDIVIPNEQFITHSFQNWTHKDTRQRYSLEFSVTYATDLHALFDLLRTVVTSHPQVLGGDNVAEEFQPDAEIAGFSQTGVDILVEYWIDGVDDGELRVKADLMLMIWDIFKTHAIEFAVPARETIKFQNETIKFQQEVIKCLESLNDRYAALQQT